jgi:hypothetical protein
VLPPLPGEQVTPVPDPGLGKSEDPRLALPRTRAAWAQCEDERSDLIDFYERLRKPGL